MRGRCLVVVMMLAAGVASAGVYKWKDADGRLHYTETPPPGDRQTEEINAEISVTSFTGIPILSGSTTAMSGARLKMYGAPWCGVCKRAKTWLAANHVSYDYYDVEA